jgi:hypothetical protein
MIDAFLSYAHGYLAIGVAVIYCLVVFGAVVWLDRQEWMPKIRIRRTLVEPGRDTFYRTKVIRIPDQQLRKRR